MAQKRIQDLENAEELFNDMLIPVAGSNKTQSVLLSQLRAFLNKYLVEKENQNFNNLTDDGFYQCGGTSQNAPVGQTVTWVVSVVNDGSSIVQTAYSTDATGSGGNFPTTYRRRYNGSSWTAWTGVDGSAKQNTITGGASTITSNNLTASRALVSDGSGKVAVSAVTSTELGYLDGVTSNLQTQLNARAKTDLCIVSTVVKQTAVGWGIPDYSAGISKSLGVENTAESAGEVRVNYFSTSYGWYRATVNGNATIFQTTETNNGLGAGYTGECYVSGVFYVNKGDKWKIEHVRGTVKELSIKFYPLKGV